MSESGDSQLQGEDTQGHQSSMENTGPLVAVHVENLHVSETKDNEDDDEPEPGDQNNDRRRLNRRLDSGMYDQVTARGNVTVDGLFLEQTTLQNRPLTGPRRMNTAPVNRQNAEARQLLFPPRANTLQEWSVSSDERDLEVENSCVCGIFECKSTDTLWLEGGSLRRMNEGEEIVVEKASHFGDCCRIICLLSFILVTNRQFIVKQLLKIGPFNVHTEEASYHFANLEHVRVERSIITRRNRNRFLIISGLLTLSLGLLRVQERVPLLGSIFFAFTIIYGTYSFIMFLIRYCVSFLIVDVSKPHIVGSWSWGFFTKGRSFLTVSVPLPIYACFEVMNKLMERHPLLSQSEGDV